ncbi:MAG: TfoX/Sxy family protein [Chloroflexi bacterium]|nr:TfoX/Sxy family protein [Chloroflexota bacterium]
MAYNEELAERMRAKLKFTRGVVEKKMFGGVGFLVNGNMACGVNKQDLIVRLSDADFEKALKQKGVRIFDMTGRPMKGWILVSEAGYASDKALEGWIEKGVAFAKSLPKK